MEYAAAIISAIGAIITGLFGMWIKSNQATKDKITDLKIEKWKKEEEVKAKRRADNSAIIYNELHDILRELNADRVYIVQPHPIGNESLLSIYYEIKRKGVEPMKPHIQNLKIPEVAKFAAEMVQEQPHPIGNESLLSIYYEIKRKGVEPMKPHIQNLKIPEVAKFAAEMVQERFMYITDIDEQVADKYARSLLNRCGTTGAIIKRLSDNTHDWIGSIFCEFTGDMECKEEEAREVLHAAATNIQYLLPEYK